MYKRLFAIILTCALLSSLVGCGAVTPIQVDVSNSESLSHNQLARFIKNNNDLHYDQATRIVYLRNKNSYGGSYTPYYAPNGLPYRYNPETNTFEEING